MSTKRDYYDVLGVGKNTSPDELKKSYRALALKWHPDRNKSPEAEGRFKEINEAYEVLSNPQKRSTYDQFGHTAFNPGASPGGRAGSGSSQKGPFTYTYHSGSNNPFADFGFGSGGFSDPFEIFSEFFGGGNPFGRRGPAKPHYSLRIEFMEAVKGSEKTVSIGSKSHLIKIPPGSRTGTHLRFTDFDVSLDVAPDPVFKSEGDDVYIAKDIPFTLAILGGSIEVPTLWDKIKIKIRPGTQPGTMVRLKGQGIPTQSGAGKGDQYIRLSVTLPQSLSRRQKQLLEEFENS